MLFERLGLPLDRVTDLDDRRQWPAYKQRFTEIFKSKPSAHWCALLEGTDACFAPVLAPGAAHAHPHNRARGTFIEVDGVMQPAPAPRFSRTPAGMPTAPVAAGASGVAAAVDWGLARPDLQALIERGVVVERAS